MATFPLFLDCSLPWSQGLKCPFPDKLQGFLWTDQFQILHLYDLNCGWITHTGGIDQEVSGKCMRSDVHVKWVLRGEHLRFPVLAAHIWRLNLKSYSQCMYKAEVASYNQFLPSSSNSNINVRHIKYIIKCWVSQSLQWLDFRLNSRNYSPCHLNQVWGQHKLLSKGYQGLFHWR